MTVQIIKAASHFLFRFFLDIVENRKTMWIQIWQRISYIINRRFYSHKNWLQIQERTKFLLSQKMIQKTVWMGAISSNFWILTSCSGFCTKNETAKRVVGNNGVRWYISISTKRGLSGKHSKAHFWAVHTLEKCNKHHFSIMRILSEWFLTAK